MGILVVIALETNTITKIVLAMESGIIAINANANTANLGSITTIVLCSVIIIVIIIIDIEISLSIETIATRLGRIILSWRRYTQFEYKRVGSWNDIITHILWNFTTIPSAPFCALFLHKRKQLTWHK